MRGISRQVAIVLLALPAIVSAAARGPFAQQLARECDALLDDAVRRPFGWGWDVVPLEAPPGRSTPRNVMYEPPGSAGAGLVLLWAGELLEEPRYRQAAIEVAKGLVASQQPTGKIPEHALFSAANVSSRDPVAVVPDRSATRAAAALLITLLQSDIDPPENLKRSVQRAGQWMVRQQTADGSWPSAYAPDPAARRGDRILRLETTDYRDSTLVLLMLADALDDPEIVRAANKSVAKLIALRLGAGSALPSTQPSSYDGTEPKPQSANVSVHLNNLWTSAYRLDGSIDPALTEFPLGADMLASRMAMQTLMGAYLLTGQRQTGLTLDSAMVAANQLRLSDGRWRRLYLPNSPLEIVDEPQQIFGVPTTQPQRVLGTFDLPRTLESASQLKILGQQRYRNLLAGPIGLYQQVSATAAGIIDDPFTIDTPLSRAEVAPYLATHSDRFSQLEWSPPRDLSPRVRRLWLLLLRARLETMQQEP